MVYHPKHWSAWDEIGRLTDGFGDEIAAVVDGAAEGALKEFIGGDNCCSLISYRDLRVWTLAIDEGIESAGEPLIDLIDFALGVDDGEQPELHQDNSPLPAMRQAYLDWIAAHPGWKPWQKSSAS